MAKTVLYISTDNYYPFLQISSEVDYDTRIVVTDDQKTWLRRVMAEFEKAQMFLKAEYRKAQGRDPQGF